MLKKVMEIKKIVNELEEINCFCMNYDFFKEGELKIHLFDLEKFMSIAEENNKKHIVEKFPCEKNPYKVSTEIEGIEFFILVDEREHDYILDKLF